MPFSPAAIESDIQNANAGIAVIFLTQRFQKRPYSVENKLIVPIGNKIMSLCGIHRVDRQKPSAPVVIFVLDLYCGLNAMIRNPNVEPCGKHKGCPAAAGHGSITL